MSLAGQSSQFYFEVSPGQKHQPRKEKNENIEIPILRLTQFTHSPKVSFEKVKLGESKTTVLKVLNPKDDPQELFCEKFPSEENGFQIDPLELHIEPAETKEIFIRWTPQKEGNVRELIQWKSNIGVRAQTVILGTCAHVPLKKKRPGKKPLQPGNVPKSSTGTHKKSALRKVPKPSGQENRPLFTKDQKLEPFKKCNKTIDVISATSEPFNSTAHGDYKALPIPAPELSAIGFDQSIAEVVSKSSSHPHKHVVWQDEELTELHTHETYIEEQMIQREVYSFPSSSKAAVLPRSHLNLIGHETVLPSPDRRQTFKVTAGNSVFFPSTSKEPFSRSRKRSYEDHRFEDSTRYSSVVNPERKYLVRKKNHLVCSSTEQFEETSNQRLPECLVEQSPIRRQTYIKSSSTENDDIQLTDDVSTDQNNTALPYFIESINDATKTLETPDMEDSTRSSAQDIKAMCMNLLSKLDKYGDDDVEVHNSTSSLDKFASNTNLTSKATCSSLPNLVTESENLFFSETYSGRLSVESDCESMQTAPTSPSEFITAPTTPVEELDDGETTIVDVQDSTLQFQMPETHHSSRLSLNESAQTIQDNSLELSFKFLPTSPRYSINASFEKNFRNMRDTSMPILEEENDDDDRRLSNGTVILESSVLSPDRLVNLDPPESFSAFNDFRGIPQPIARTLGDDYIMTSNPLTLMPFIEVTPSSDESLRTQPFTHSSFSLFQLQPKDVPETPIKTDQSFTLFDLGFDPSNNPNRCSTGVKNRSNMSPSLQVSKGGKSLFSKTNIDKDDQNTCTNSPEVVHDVIDAISSERQNHSEDHNAMLPSTNIDSEKQSLTFIHLSPAKKKDIPKSLPTRPSTIRKEKVFPKPAIAVVPFALRQKHRLPSKSPVKNKSSFACGIRSKSRGVIKCSPNKKLNVTKDATMTKHSKSASRLTLKKPSSSLSQSRLMLHQSSQSTGLVHHPNPYAAKNMYYDDRWTEKQKMGFTKWLNFILTPPDEENTTGVIQKVDVSKLWMEANRCSSMKKAPSREAMSLKSYTAKRHLAELRRSACRLYQTPQMAGVISKLEMSVEKKLICIRADRQTHADLGLKQEMLKLTLSYNPLWLRIGLETVFGEILPLTSNSDVTGLTHFLITRLLSNPDIGARFAHPTVPHRYKPGFEEATKVFQLKKFLMLVYFLDHAKTSRLIDHDPCLFNKEAPLKTSKDILIAFAREFLQGVGDITKHLAYMGYVVSHKQTALDEFDYSVSNLSSDLRCGIRLAKVAEILTQDFSLSQYLRLPAISRLQKVHNVDVALTCLAKVTGKDLKVKYPSKDIVDGHKEKTLELLWNLIFSLQIQNVLSVNRLLEEIAHLKRTLRVKSSYDQRAFKASVFTKEEEKRLSEEEKEPSCTTEKILLLLKQWTQVVCAHYGLEIDNLTVSFCDGRAFCFLLHHYHNELLKESDILMETTQTMPISTQSSELNDSYDEDVFSQSNYMDPQEVATRLVNDKANFSLFINKVHELGAVPILIRPNDMINTIPDEKVTSTFLAYLCARLLDLSTEIKAARVIQLAWRTKLAARKLLQLKIQTAAVTRIQKWWRNIRIERSRASYERAAIVIQCYWRRKKAQVLLQSLKDQREMDLKNSAASKIQRQFRSYMLHLRAKKIASAIIIQRKWKSYAQRKQYLETIKKVIRVQAIVRRWLEQKKYQKNRNRIIILQKRIRETIVARQERKNFIAMRTASVIIQRSWRLTLERKRSERHLVELKATETIGYFMLMCVRRRQFVRLREAAIVIQKNYKSFCQRRQFQRLVKASITIQSFWKNQQEAKLMRQYYLELKHCTIVIQRAYRNYVSKQLLKKRISACTIIQSHYRRWVTQKEYKQKRTSVLFLQKTYRRWVDMKNQRDKYLFMKSSSIIIQSAWKCFSQQREFLKTKQSAVIIQSNWRMQKAKKDFTILKNATILIQRKWKSTLEARKVRENFLLMKQKVTVLQAFIRGWKERKIYLNSRKSIILIQSLFKRKIVRARFLQIKQACCLIQYRFRLLHEMKQDRLAYLAKKQSTVRIQTAYRGYICRNNLRKLKVASIVIQKHWRGLSVRRKIMKLKNSVQVVEKYYGARMEMQLARQQFLQKRNSCMIIQKTWRGFKSRQNYKKQIEAIVIIQKNLRMMIVRKEFNSKKQSAVTIQNQFRAWSLGKRVREEFLTYEKSAVVLQKSYRMKRCREDFMKTKGACVIIQRWLRSIHLMTHERLYYQNKRSSCLVLQSYCRRWICQRKFQHQKAAAVILQKNWRGYSDRKNLKIANQSAIMIQKNWRAFAQRREYLCQRNAVICIQQYWRATLTAKTVRSTFTKQKVSSLIIQSHCRRWICQRKFQCQKAAAVILQKNWRGYSDRKNLKIANQSAVTIQKNWRAFAQRREYLCQRNAVICIQQYWRAALTAKTVRSTFTKQKVSSLVIQSHCRRWICQRKFQCQKAAAVILQKNWRGYSDRKNLKIANQSAIMIQKNWRAFAQRREYLCQRNAVICIQQYWRAALTAKTVRSTFTKQKVSSLVIQSHCRRWICQRKFQRQKAAAIILQKHWRGYSVRKNILIMNQSAVIIQKNYRSFAQKREYVCKRNAAICIQQYWRATVTTREKRSNFIEQKAASVILQSHCRRWISLRKFQRQKAAAVILQKNWRGYSDRKNLKIANQSAVTIQKMWRSFVQKRQYLRQRKAIMCIQKYWRATITGKANRSNFLKQKSSAIIIQKYFRGYAARMQYLLQLNSAVKIQSYWRMFSSKRRFNRQQKAAVVIQTFFRSYKLMQCNLVQFQRIRSACVVIQSYTRGTLTRKHLQHQHNAATKIQACFKAYLHRKLFLKKLEAVLTIQRYFNLYKESQRVLQEENKKLKSVIKLQSIWRGNRVRKHLRRSHEASVIIQSYVRSWIQRKQYSKLLRSTKIIQTRWRSTLQMRREQRQLRIVRGAIIHIQATWRGRCIRLQYLEQHNAAAVIQATFKAWKQKQHYLEIKKSVLVLQKWWRNQILTMNTQEEFQMKRQAAMTIQKNFRLYYKSIQRKRLEYHSASVIQSCWRMYVQRSNFLYVKEKTTILCNWWRSYTKSRRVRAEFLEMKESAIIIQRYWRGVQDTRKMNSELEKKEKCAIKIQSWWRKELCVRDFQKKRTAIVILQRSWRGALQTLAAKEYFIYLRRAAIIIQAAWRGKQERRFVVRLKATLVIQNRVRKWLAKKHADELERRKYLVAFAEEVKYHLSVIKIQRYFRRKRELKGKEVHIIRIQRFVRTWIEKKKYCALRTASIVIQKRWRTVLENRKQANLHSAATKIQSIWRGFYTRKEVQRKCRRMTIILERFQEVNATATEAKKLGNKTDNAIYVILHYKDLQKTLLAVMVLDTCTKLSSVCCEKLATEKSLNVLVYLLQSCNRSAPHIQILECTISVLMNLSKYSKTLPVVQKMNQLVPSIVSLMKIFYDKGPVIFCRSSTLLYILATTDPKILIPFKDIMSSLTSMIQRKRLGRDPKKTKPQKMQRPSLKPDWLIMTSNQTREFQDPLSGLNLLKQM